MQGSGTDGLVVCIPVYDDWNAASLLLELLDRASGEIAEPIRVVLVDDGSREPLPERLEPPPQNLQHVEILPLRANLGHQRAIALGLTFIYDQRPCRAVVVMDGDGEDSPDDVVKLVAALEASGGSAVFAARERRTEGLVFRAGYLAFKVVHRLFTGRRVEVGNFSILPWTVLERLVGVSEIWNHYAAAVYKARLPVTQIPLPRAARLSGQSKMNFVELVTHGLSAISVYGETVGVRLLTGTAILAVLAAIGFVAVSPLGVAEGGWIALAAGVLAVLLVSLFLTLTVAVLFVLQSRERYRFLPLRDYRHYVLPERSLCG